MKPRRLDNHEQQTLSLTITSLGHQGEGLAVQDGRRIYVPGALAGEIVEARLTEQLDRDVFRATLSNIVAPSSDRASAPCGLYGQCGGCSVQHLSDSAYQAWKLAQITQRLNAAGIVPVHMDKPVFIPHATRRRASFGLLRQGKKILAGFNSRRSNRLVPVDDCLVLDPLILSSLRLLQSDLPNLLPDRGTGDLFLQAVDGQVEAVFTGELPTRRGLPVLEVQEAVAAMVNRAGLAAFSIRRRERDVPEEMIRSAPLHARFGRLNVALPPGAFLQPSREGEQALSDAVMTMLEPARQAAGPLFDLFAGCGTFAGRMLDIGPVQAYEVDGAAVGALSAARGSERLRVEKRNLFNEPLSVQELKSAVAVVFDPPRAGAAEQMRTLARSDVKVIVSVSCNPASFLRDSQILIDGNYRLERLRLVDQFIWSSHSELVGQFIR